MLRAVRVSFLAERRTPRMPVRTRLTHSPGCGENLGEAFLFPVVERMELHHEEGERSRYEHRAGVLAPVRPLPHQGRGDGIDFDGGASSVG